MFFCSVDFLEVQACVCVLVFSRFIVLKDSAHVVMVFAKFVTVYYPLLFSVFFTEVPQTLRFPEI